VIVSFTTGGCGLALIAAVVVILSRRRRSSTSTTAFTDSEGDGEMGSWDVSDDPPEIREVPHSVTFTMLDGHPKIHPEGYRALFVAGSVIAPDQFPDRSRIDEPLQSDDDDDCGVFEPEWVEISD
jgi:hypothetical protein